MGSHLMTQLGDLSNNPDCRCPVKCCYFEGCCTGKASRRCDASDIPEYVEPYTPVEIRKPDPASAHGRSNFLRLPAELRNSIYELNVLEMGVLHLSLNPTIMDHDKKHTWGMNNKFALLGVCRKIYHEVAPWAYGANWYDLERGTHRDFSIPKHIGMPYKSIQHMILIYPRQYGPCCWDLSHFWGHLLRDTDAMLKSFPKLKKLIVKMHYNAFQPRYINNLSGWQALMVKQPRESTEDQRARMVKVLKALAQLYGQKMDKRVYIEFEKFMTNGEDPPVICPPDHDPSLINEAIIKAYDRKIDVQQHLETMWPYKWPVNSPDIHRRKKVVKEEDDEEEEEVNWEDVLMPAGS